MATPSPENQVRPSCTRSSSRTTEPVSAGSGTGIVIVAVPPGGTSAPRTPRGPSHATRAPSAPYQCVDTRTGFAPAALHAKFDAFLIEVRSVVDEAKASDAGADCT